MRRLRRSDDGVAAVEFAFLLTILLLLSIVAAEFGFAFVDWLAMSNATRTAARVAASGGDEPTTDAAVLDAIEEAASGAPRARLSSVDIFEIYSDGTEGPPTTYTYAAGAFGACAPCGWPASARSTQYTSLDSLGVRVHFQHDWVVGLWSTRPSNWSDAEVIRLEPDFGL